MFTAVGEIWKPKGYFLGFPDSILNYWRILHNNPDFCLSHGTFFWIWAMVLPLGVDGAWVFQFPNTVISAFCFIFCLLCLFTFLVWLWREVTGIGVDSDVQEKKILLCLMLVFCIQMDTKPHPSRMKLSSLNFFQFKAMPFQVNSPNFISLNACDSFCSSLKFSHEASLRRKRTRCRKIKGSVPAMSGLDMRKDVPRDRKREE